MSEAKHTPEPWQVSTLDGKTVVHDTGDRPGLQGVPRMQAVVTPRLVVDDETTTANAYRIVAAINATAGIPTEALEQGVVAELLAACQEAAGRCPCTVKERLSGHLTGCWVPAVEAAIARATGKAVQP